jgi:two-component system LytT family response regulator
MIRVVIIDDERSARETIKTLLEKNFTNVHVAGLAESVEDGYDCIVSEKPDLIFLDVSMPPSNGFELLKKFNQPQFEIVFTTAYSEYAIKAIKHAAADYLLKPVDTQELIDAVKKVSRKILDKHQGNLERLRVSLPGNKSFVFVSADDIIRVEASGRKLKIILRTRTLEVTQTFEELEAQLPAGIFFRSHRGHLINMNEMKEYIPDKNGGCVIMTDGKLVPVAARKKNDFMMALK